MPPPSDREYWRNLAYELDDLDRRMGKCSSANSPEYQALDRRRHQIFDEADRAKVYLPNYK